jgi:ubiquinone biosynthesis protein UbiJ
VVKAKVAGQSREQMVNALLGGSKGQSQVKLANLLSQAAEGLSEEERVLLTNPENQALIFNEFRDFAKNVDCTLAQHTARHAHARIRSLLNTFILTTEVLCANSAHLGGQGATVEAR